MEPSKDRTPLESTPVWVGDRQTWLDRCTWSGDKRCYRAARRESFCEWHMHCLDSGQMATDFKAFSVWFHDSGEKSGWSVGEAFTSVKGDRDPYYDMRIDFGMKKYKSEKQSHQDVVVNREFLRAILILVSDGKIACFERLKDMMEQFPYAREAIMAAGNQINDTHFKN